MDAALDIRAGVFPPGYDGHGFMLADYPMGDAAKQEEVKRPAGPRYERINPNLMKALEQQEEENRIYMEEQDAESLERQGYEVE